MLLLIIILIALYLSLRFIPKKLLRFLSPLCVPFVNICIVFRLKKRLEDKSRITERFGLPSQKRPVGKLIWIHAVSVGETLSVIPLINEIKRQKPDVSILLTTMTVTAAQQVEQRLGDKVIHQFVPFDIFSWIRRFVKYWKPSVAMFIESELWPNMLFYLNDKNIPIYLLNARISDHSLARMFFIKKYFGILPFSLFSSVLTTSVKMKNATELLGAHNVRVLPNLKFVSDKLPVNETNRKRLAQKISKRKAWIAVSTHPGEEEMIIKSHKMIKQDIPDILTIIAIRHPARVSEVSSLGTSKELSVSIYSETMRNRKHIIEDLLLIDEMGCLGEFFEIVDTVLVCGSLVPGIGGHNFLEPLSFDCNVAIGKHIDNFKDIYPYVKDFCIQVSAISEIKDFVVKSVQEYERSECHITTLNFKAEWKNELKEILKVL